MSTQNIKENAFIPVAIVGAVAGILVTLFAMVYRTLSGIEDPSFSALGLPVTLVVSGVAGAAIAVLIACAVCAVIAAIQYVINKN